MVNILVIASDPASRTPLRMILPPEYQLVGVDALQDIRSAIRRAHPDVVVLDAEDDCEIIMAVVRRAGSMPLAPPLVVVSSLRNDEIIVAAIHAGAFDYIVKPYTSSRLLHSIERAVMAYAATGGQSSDESSDSVGEQFLGSSRPARQVRCSIRSYSRLDAPVLLQGESGTGKDLAAQLIHDNSRRASGPFEPVNCAAVPEPLFESEVFGSERGAFTGAVSRPGLFERSAGGTLFLDEIGETSIHVQVKLLRAIDSCTIVRVGGLRPVPVDSRLIVATNRDLRTQVASGGFRSDLYYRVCVLPLDLPPLRDRAEDIPLLAWHWLRRLEPGGKLFTPAAIERLVAHSWPGNVRELRNVVQRSLLLSSGDRISAGAIQSALAGAQVVPLQSARFS